MSKWRVLLVILQLYDTCYGNHFYNGTELVLAFLVHRHGDRTPLEDRIMYSNDPERLQELVKPYGYGRLTNKGINRAYELGKFLRNRYNDLLSPSFNDSEVYLRATDSFRTQMSALAAMAAVYPPNQRAWNPHLNWTPTPYTMVPKHEDPYLPTHNCPKYKNAYAEKLNNKSSEMPEFADVFDELADLGYNCTEKQLKIFEIVDTFVCQLSMGLPLDSRVHRLFPRIKAAMDKAWDILYGDERYISLQGGVLLHDFLDVAEKATAGQPTQKLRIFSAHDSNVYSLIAVSRALPRPGWPKFSSMFSLELRRITKTGRYAVLPVYLSTPGEKIKYLQVEGCPTQLCDMDLFRRLVSKYVLAEAEWRKECNN